MIKLCAPVFAHVCVFVCVFLVGEGRRVMCKIQKYKCDHQNHLLASCHQNTGEAVFKRLMKKGGATKEMLWV